MKSNRIRTAIVLGGAFLVGEARASAQETTRVNVDSAGSEAIGFSECQSISADGRFVAFQSDAANLVPDDTNGVDDAFVHDRVTGITERVSVDSSGGQGDGLSGAGSLSADGRFIAFGSAASNLVTGDANGVEDVFVRDRVTGTTELVSIDSSGNQGNGMSAGATLSADGRFVAFESVATNLVAGDTNGVEDVFVHDRVRGITERVTVDSFGGQGTRYSRVARISADGRFVGFVSDAPNLVANDSNGCLDAFVHDLVTGNTERVSVDSSGNQGNKWTWLAAISGDGRFVVMSGPATNLVAGDFNQTDDVFVRDRVTGTTERVDVDSHGRESNDGGWAGDISADGRFVAFGSNGTNLVSADTNGVGDTFVHDRLTGFTERVSVNSQGGEAHSDFFLGSDAAMISADGQFVAFTSYAYDLVPGDTNSNEDVFVHERGPIRAFWSNYGAGFPGTTGVASITSRVDPVLGTTITLDLGNSRGEYTVGALFIGFEPTLIHSNWGGDLLVVPQITQLVGLTPWGASLFGDIPDDESLCGCFVELQAIEADPGAAKGVSFTRGLELVLGR